MPTIPGDLPEGLRALFDAVTSARKEYVEAHSAATGRGTHIADLLAQELPVEQHWVDAYVEARDRAEAAKFALFAAARDARESHAEYMLKFGSAA